MARAGCTLSRLVQVVSAVLFGAVLHGTAMAQANFPGADGTVFPAAPRGLEQVWVKFVCIDLERCAGGKVTMAGNVITVVRYTASCFVCDYPVTAFVELGRLPAGAYMVRIVSPAGILRSTQQLAVTDPNPPGPYALPTLNFPLGNYTDQWWDAKEPGWGLAITQHVGGALFAVWAVYGPDGKPVWYTLQPGSWTAYNRYSGPVYRTTGPWFGGVYANGPAVTETPAGTATLTFADPANGTMQFSVDGAAGVKSISRLVF